jgi:hypothetical protein
MRYAYSANLVKSADQAVPLTHLFLWLLFYTA